MCGICLSWTHHIFLAWFPIFLINRSTIPTLSFLSPPLEIFNFFSSHQSPPILTFIANQFWFHSPSVKVLYLFIFFGLLLLNSFVVLSLEAHLQSITSDVAFPWKTSNSTTTLLWHLLSLENMTPLAIYGLDITSVGKPYLNPLYHKILLASSHAAQFFKLSSLKNKYILPYILCG